MADIAQVRVNNTDYNFADDTKVPYDLLQDTVGWTGKNLVKRPYYHGDSRTESGITFTVNADGSIRVQGTPTATVAFTVMHNIHFNNVISTGCPSGSEGTKYKLSYINLRDNSIQYNDFGEGVVIPNDDSSDLYDYRVVIYPAAGNIDKTFYPMLRKADIMDDTYEQYNPSVKQVFRNNKIIEGKNLVPFPYKQTTLTNNGITYTDNGDGSVTANGTATATSFFNFYYDKPFEAGNYVFSGCPSGGTQDGYKLLLRYKETPSSGEIDITHNYGGDTNFVITPEQANYAVHVIVIRIGSGTTVSNLVFKPMIRKATETDPTYEKYYIPGVVSQEAQNVLGAKNLLLYPYHQTTKTENGITFTDNGNGTITATGTNSSASANANFECSVLESTFKLPKGQYRLTGCPKGGSNSTYLMQLYSTTTYLSSVRDDIGNGVNLYLSSDEAIRVVIRIRPEYAISGSLIFKPMIRLVSVLDDTYVPYAKTNRELTEIVQDLLARVEALES